MEYGLSSRGTQLLGALWELGCQALLLHRYRLAPASPGPADLGHGEEAALHGYWTSPNWHDCGGSRGGPSEDFEDGEPQGGVQTREKRGPDMTSVADRLVL